MHFCMESLMKRYICICLLGSLPPSQTRFADFASPYMVCDKCRINGLLSYPLSYVLMDLLDPMLTISC